jgi:hypothetical protein
VPAGSSFQPVELYESNAVTGLSFTPFSTPVISADLPTTLSFQQQLLLAQAQKQS